MKMTIPVAVLVGSLRNEAYSTKMAHAFLAAAPPEFTLEIMPLGQLPQYNEELDAKEPSPLWVAFREQVGEAKALLFVTPEQNRSIPAVLKNALDVASRPYGHNRFNGKPGAVVSTSIGAIGGVGANHHLHQSLIGLNVPLMQQPEASLGEVDKFFDNLGTPLTACGEYAAAFMKTYAQWVHTILSTR
ncbi:NADPH-dependent FMN reductase [Desulfovibrio cuneatus]|uniref:NADPH-dependent FMN reductase n=1 Tax=Desulfovibrio cuneatus TaxID=159728 RepID=UPI00048A1327|nr:NAD(P)H-dependent oxidoreductase [Desulfovibrio cuneatus]